MLKAKVNKINGKFDTEIVEKIVPITGALGFGCIGTAIIQYIFKSVDPGILIGAISLTIWNAGRQHLKQARADKDTSHIPKKYDALVPKQKDASKKTLSRNGSSNFFYEVE